jgi:UBX domain-containing protein 1
VPEPRDLFAGGGKSGLAVQDPNDLKRKILEKAKKLDTGAIGG